MTGPSKKCLVKGSVNIDEFFDVGHIVRPGETLSSHGFERSAGGKGANQANAVARAGGLVDLDCNMGQDGKWIRDVLAEVGVGVERVHVLDKQSSGRAFIQRATDGENSIILYPGANFYPIDEHPHLAGYSHLLLQNEIPLEITTSYLEEAGKLGIDAVFNPSPMLSAQECQRFPWRSLRWLIVNKGELDDICKALLGATERDVNANLIALYSSSFFDSKVSLICTLGADGVLYMTNPGTTNHLPAAKLQNPLKDTTGAGDCFAGYLVAGLMRDEPIEDTIQSCLTACAICVETVGAMSSAPLRSAVLSRMGVCL